MDLAGRLASPTIVFGGSSAFFLTWTVVALGEHGYAPAGCKITPRLQDKA
jgi:hypothetical protein